MACTTGFVQLPGLEEIETMNPEALKEMLLRQVRGRPMQLNMMASDSTERDTQDERREAQQAMGREYCTTTHRPRRGQEASAAQGAEPARKQLEEPRTRQGEDPESIPAPDAPELEEMETSQSQKVGTGRSPLTDIFADGIEPPYKPAFTVPASVPSMKMTPTAAGQSPDGGVAVREVIVEALRNGA